MKDERILVTGAAGYIGSHCVLELLNAGYQILAVDNFANSVPDSPFLLPTSNAVSLSRVEQLTGKKIPFVSLDVTDYDGVKDLLGKNKIDCIMHFAGLKAVGESVEKPLDYYRVNLMGALVLLRAAAEEGIKKFVFSSSATVYGFAEKLPLTENCSVGVGITNPYGQTKYMIERILFDLAKSDPVWSIVILRYFNPVGSHASGEIGEDPKGLPNNLMPYVSQVAIGKLPAVRVFGDDYDTPDGTGVRDYIHVVDLAKGHVAALKALTSSATPKVYNLGTGRGYSVIEMIRAMEKACGHKIPYEIQGRREGDLATVYCDPKLAEEEIGWKAQLDIDDMCRDLWKWQQKNPNGFQQSE